MLNLSRFTHFSWGKIWIKRFALCKKYDISQLCLQNTSTFTRQTLFNWVWPARSWWLLVFLADQSHKVIERLLREIFGKNFWSELQMIRVWSQAYNDQLITSLSQCDSDIILKVSSWRLRDELWQRRRAKGESGTIFNWWLVRWVGFQCKLIFY